MDAKERAACAAVLKHIFALSWVVRVGLNDRGRPTPQLSSTDLWRTFPRLLTSACDLADKLGGILSEDDTETIRGIAAVIDGRKGKVTA